MQKIERGLAVLLLACSSLLLCGAPASARSDKMKILYGFCVPTVCASGDQPNPLISDSAGNLFGTTVGGPDYIGKIFELRRHPGGRYEYSVLYTFDEVVDPIGALVMDTKGNLYGAAEGFSIIPGDLGEIFELSPQKHGSWTLNVLYKFCPQMPCTDGATPLAGLAYANQRSGALYDGKSPLFGTTREGGAYSGGTVFVMQPGKDGWVHEKLYDFCASGPDCTDGKGPEAQLLVDGSGNLFGVTTYGGNTGTGNGSGTAFELTPAGTTWTETVLHAFCSQVSCTDGEYPQSAVAFDSTGNLYGFTTAGGAPCLLRKQFQRCGVAYKIVPNGANPQETVLHDFCSDLDCQDGAFPESTPFFDGSGNLFGTALAGGDRKNTQYRVGGGTVFGFSLADPDNTFRVLHKFCQEAGCSDGDQPAEFIGDPSEAIIGTTRQGGPDNEGTVGGGIIYRLTPHGLSGLSER
jgi:hypothetical protein